MDFHLLFDLCLESVKLASLKHQLMLKLAARTVSLAIVAGALVFFSNCGGDDKPTPPEQTQLKNLSKTWNISSATLNGTNRTSPDFNNFTLTISGTFNSGSPSGPYNFSVGGSRPDPSPWPASGTWTFTNIGTGNSGSLLRNDGVPITYSIASNGQLTLELICTSCDYPGARTEQVNGTWVFVLN
jgi:hypothetical protein